MSKAAKRTLYVAPEPGMDGVKDGSKVDGSRKDPLTLTGARDLVRAWKQQGIYPPEGVTIVLLPGDYELARSLDLNARDSGRASAPMTWRAESPGTVRLTGGRRVTVFKPVTEPAVLDRLSVEVRGQVAMVDLKAMGITDYGIWHPRGHGGGSANSALEVFCHGVPLTPARWPKRSPLANHGFELIADVRGDCLVYTDDRPARWAVSDDIHLHGHFAMDWTSTIVRVTRLDTQKKEIEVVPARTGHYGMRKGGRYFYFNVLEELSEPGEWCLDRQSGILYVWLPVDPASADVRVSFLETPLVNCVDVESVRFEGLTFECTRGDAVAMTGGRGITLAGCRITNIGRAAVRIDRGYDHVVQSCDVWNIGESGVDIANAGDRRLGESSGHRVENCWMHHMAREGWTYFECVRVLNCCGVTIRHNRFHDHPHAMIMYRGNDHLIEYNEFYNFTLQGDDCGCLYYGRDFTLQGNVVRYNYLHHAGDSGRNDWGSSGVYNDDGAGGSDIYGNIFHLVNKGVLAGGGINIRIHHNLFVACEPAIWFDERLASAQADRGETMMHGWMRDQFYALNGHRPPFASRYPGMDAVHDALQRGVGLAALNAQVKGNLVYGSRGSWLKTHWAEFPEYFEYAANVVEDRPPCEDAAFGVFEIKPDHPACRTSGYKPLPFEKYGLYRDSYRPKLESARTAMEVVNPVGSTGTGGRLRLRLRNDGDVPVQGVERVEIKRQRHGPGFMRIDVPFDVQPGGETAVEFDLAVDPVALQDCYELFVFTRGEQIRPVWISMPVACRLDSRIDLLDPVTWGTGVLLGRIQMHVSNLAGTVTDTSVVLKIDPPDGVEVNPGTINRRLAPGACIETESSIRLKDTGGPLVSRIVLTTAGRDVKPAAARLTVRYPLRQLPQRPSLDCLEARLKDQPVLPVKGAARLAASGYYGDIRLAVADGRLLVSAVVFDTKIEVTPLLWDGSCVEVFACNPDRERIGHVFGNIEIGQVYLVPACGVEPARAYRFQHNQPVPKPCVQVATAADPRGYRLQALVPFTELALDPDAVQFLFEVQVTAHLEGAPRGEGRGNLFGSPSAFNDTSRYALAVVE